MTPATDTQDDLAQRFAATAAGLTIPSLLDRNAAEFGDRERGVVTGVSWRQTSPERGTGTPPSLLWAL